MFGWWGGHRPIRREVQDPWPAAPWRVATLCGSGLTIGGDSAQLAGPLSGEAAPATPEVATPPSLPYLAAIPADDPVAYRAPRRPCSPPPFSRPSSSPADATSWRVLRRPCIDGSRPPASKRKATCSTPCLTPFRVAQLPESTEAYALIVGWFNRWLGVER